MTQSQEQQGIMIIMTAIIPRLSVCFRLYVCNTVILFNTNNNSGVGICQNLHFMDLLFNQQILSIYNVLGPRDIKVNKTLVLMELMTYWS